MEREQSDSIITVNIGNDMQHPECSRVITLPLLMPSEHIKNVIDRVLSLDEEKVASVVYGVFSDFSNRHRDIEVILVKHYQKVEQYIPQGLSLSHEQKLLIGSIFTKEYSVESAALFNPSIVPHPDQNGVSEGSLRFIMSLRGTGEGHISSIEFRSGIINKVGNVKFDKRGKFAEIPEAIEKTVPLEQSDYGIRFNENLELSERVIFPVSAIESKGMEDARFVKFTDDDGKENYYATYTAYNGKAIQPQLIETEDFLTFKMSSLKGNAAQSKGMALFPRKIDGKYAMLARIDGENNSIMFSDDINNWQEVKKIQTPEQAWELLLIGNCGSPIETEKGWLMITHGVGPMRKYSISAILLDLDDPSKVIGQLTEPLLTPTEEEREGYVPNVVYSCGSLEHNGNLILPYAASDQIYNVATISIPELLEKFESCKHRRMLDRKKVG